jgi:hypothetical protein
MAAPNDRQLQVLSVFVHGALTFGHLLGIAYNWKRRNWFDVTAHTAAATYDIWATHKHLTNLQEIPHVF